MIEARTGIEAFESGGRQGWARGFVVTTRDILKAPTETFSAMDREGSVGLPLLFALLVSVLPEVLTTTIELASPGALGWFGPGLEGDMAARWAGVGEYWLLLGGMFASDVLITAPMLWAMLKLTGQRCPPLRAIFRVACYSGAPTLLAPGLLASAVVGLWGLFLLCVGVKAIGGPRPIGVFGALAVGQIGGLGIAMVLSLIYNSIT